MYLNVYRNVEFIGASLYDVREFVCCGVVQLLVISDTHAWQLQFTGHHTVEMRCN